MIGRKLDVDATLAAIEGALEKGERKARVVFLEQKPRRVAAELEAVAFDEVLGYFETRYDRSAAGRGAHLQPASGSLASSTARCCLPGETFDFNSVVGPRDEANGYKVAHVIAEGELVDGIGGGTCQISGTLHGAAFFAGLDIVERYPHAAERVHQDGARRDGRVPDHQLPDPKPVVVPDRAPRDGEERRGARGDPRAETHAYRDADPARARLDPVRRG